MTTCCLRATELNRVLFSRDRDLLAIAADWLRTNRDFAELVYAHPLQVTIGKAVQDLELMARVAEPRELMNCVLRRPL